MQNKKLIYGALSYGALATMVMLTTTACVVRTNARPPRARVTVNASTPPPPQANVTIQANTTPTVSSGVTIVEASCQQGAQEACNGLDDNCDGVIDEGCGYQTGNIQITLGWATGADLDMYVTDPQGNTIYYGAPQSPTGGALDHDARGACGSGYAPGSYNTENVYFDMPNPPPGQYSVAVEYWDGPCSSRNGVTQFTLSVAVGGQVLGTWGNNLAPQSPRFQVISFQI